jgi:hypothetical protein
LENGIPGIISGLKAAEFQEMYRAEVVGDPQQGGRPALRLIK